MNITVVTLFPDLYQHFLQTSLLKNAIGTGKITVNLINLLQLSTPGCRVDEPTVGPGPGMILKPEIVEHGIQTAKQTYGDGFTIFFSPKGQVLDQLLLNLLVKHASVVPSDTDNDAAAAQKFKPHLILVCARYEGVDHRVESQMADMLLSIGDYVLMGGDLPAQVFLEGFVRLLPNVLGNQQSAQEDSFQGPFLDHPAYGLPLTWRNQTIPEVLLSGHHQKIQDYRQQTAVKSTVNERFDWIQTHPESSNYCKQINSALPNHYVILMHSQVETGQGPGTTSVTSIDLHDIARSCATYGIKNFFVSTPLKDQQAIVQTFLDFWHSPEGIEYNISRFNAVKHLVLVDNLQQAIANIEHTEGKKPLLITTSAKKFAHQTTIDFFSQGSVWQQERPILFLFGTGRGLCQEVIAQSDFLLIPVGGFADYNHLSVRSAVGIILDRWLGYNPKTRRLKFPSGADLA